MKCHESQSQACNTGCVNVFTIYVVWDALDLRLLLLLRYTALRLRLLLGIHLLPCLRRIQRPAGNGTVPGGHCVSIHRCARQVSKGCIYTPYRMPARSLAT